ncbi:MAG: DoxX family protein [Gemmatimonadales bacterium]|nr:DoxX family protein [Gemmatimonadales bacterium]
MTGRNPGAGLLILRLVLGWLFLWQGLGKLVGPPFPGEGLTVLGWSMANFFPQLGETGSQALAVALMLLQVGGGLLLIVGWQTAIVTSLLIIQVLAAIAKIRFALGIFHPIGWEKDLVEVAALSCLLLAGPGMFSMDGRRRAAGAGSAAA